MSVRKRSSWTLDQVNKAIQMVKEGKDNAQISKSTGINIQGVNRIRRGDTYVAISGFRKMKGNTKPSAEGFNRRLSRPRTSAPDSLDVGSLLGLLNNGIKLTISIEKS